MKDMVERVRQAKGENNSRSKLTFEEVENIRRIYGMGNHTQKQVADQFGVSVSSIRKIVKGEYWKLPLAEYHNLATIKHPFIFDKLTLNQQRCILVDYLINHE